MAAGNPTLPALDNTAASGKEGELHPGTGIHHKPWGVDKYADPSHGAWITMWEFHAKTLLAGACAGMVVDLGGRDVGAYALNYQRGGALYSFPGETSTTLDADEDHYLYLDADEVLKVAHDAFPADCYHLAYVETDGADITLLEDRRWENADVGGTNAWSAVAATQDVDMGDNSLNNVEGIDFTAATELTIAAGVITPTQFYHMVDTQADAVTDDLDTITATAGKHQFLLLRPENAAHVVTVKDGTGNISLVDDDFIMDDADDLLLLMQFDDTDWIEICRNRNTLLLLTNSLNCNGEDVRNIGTLNLNPLSELTIAAGVVTVNQTFHTIDTEADAATDDLDMIMGGANNDFLLIRSANQTRAVVVKHGTGNISLSNGAEYTLDDAWTKSLLLRRESNTWIETARSYRSIEDLADTARSIPWPLQFSINGELVAGLQAEWHYYCKHELVIVNATGYVDGVPGGGTCIVNILDNGLSIFDNEGEMIVIADGAHQDTSATKNHVVAAGHVLSCEIKSTGSSPNGADDLTVSIDAMIAPKKEP